MVRVELNSRKIGLCHSCPWFALRSVYSPSFSALVSSHRKWYLSNSLADFWSFSEMGGTGQKNRRAEEREKPGYFCSSLSAPGSISLNITSPLAPSWQPLFPSSQFLPGRPCQLPPMVLAPGSSSPQLLADSGDGSCPELPPELMFDFGSPTTSIRSPPSEIPSVKNH